MVGKDLLYAGVGLFTSILIAVLVNSDTNMSEIYQEFIGQLNKFIDKLF